LKKEEEGIERCAGGIYILYIYVSLYVPEHPSSLPKDFGWISVYNSNIKRFSIDTKDALA